MNKGELIAKMVKDTKMSKNVVESALNSCLSNIKNALKRGDSVILNGFGTWSVTKRKARMGRNPQTGQPLKISGKKVPKFRASKRLQQIIR